MKYKVGDIAYVKDLKQLIKEFGQDSDASIPCAGSFVPKMFHTCGQAVTIKIADPQSKRYRVKEFPNFVFSDDMLKQWSKYDVLVHSDKTLLAKRLSLAFDLKYEDIYNWLNGDAAAQFYDTTKTNKVKPSPSIVNKTPVPEKTIEQIVAENEDIFNSIEDYDFSSVLNSESWSWNLS